MLGNEKNYFLGLTNPTGGGSLFPKHDMENQPAKDKKFVSILLKRELVKKLEKLAAHRGKSRTDVIATLLEEGTRDAELTVEDYEAIIREIKEAGLR